MVLMFPFGLTDKDTLPVGHQQLRNNKTCPLIQLGSVQQLRASKAISTRMLCFASPRGKIPPSPEVQTLTQPSHGSSPMRVDAIPPVTEVRRGTKGLLRDLFM